MQKVNRDIVITMAWFALSCGCSRSDPGPSRWTAHPRDNTSVSDDGSIRLAQRFRLSPRATEVGKNHRSVKSAFRSLTSDASHATVRLYDNRDLVSLGVIVDSDGLVLTKASLTKDNIKCRLRDGRRFEAKVLSCDEDHDVALLRIVATDLPSIQFAVVEDLSVGTWLATPGGTGQTTLAIGMVGLSARKIERDRALLGVRLGNGETGALVEEVVSSSAKQAGLQAGDVLLTANGRPTPDRRSTQRFLREMWPGEKVVLEVQRGDESLTIPATMGRWSEAFRFQGQANEDADVNGELSNRRTSFSSVIQHDTFLQPHHCGGPVVDVDARVVGLNIARASRVATYMLPGKVVNQLIKQLRQSAQIAALN